MNDDHQSLLEEARRGSEPAIESLLQRHLPALEGYLRLHAGRGIRNREQTQDLAQSVCRQVLEDLDRFEYRGEGAFRHWLFTRALHKIRDRVKFYRAGRRAMEREVPRVGPDGAEISYGGVYADLATPSQVAMGREEAARLEEVFDRLPDDYKEVITLSRIVGLSHAEIAERMGRTVEATRALLHRAIVRLSWHLGRGGEGGAPS